MTHWSIRNPIPEVEYSTPYEQAKSMFGVKNKKEYRELLDRYRSLKDQAEFYDMEVDLEELEVVPLNIKVKKWEFPEQDNWAGDPEQAWA